MASIITPDTPVWDTPSGMGGTFTVALIETDPVKDSVLARVCYGASTRRAAMIPCARGMVIRSGYRAAHSPTRAASAIQPRVDADRHEG